MLDEISLLQIDLNAARQKYTTEDSWPDDGKPWHTLKECATRFKEEAMKTTVVLGAADNVEATPVMARIRNKILKAEPPTYRMVLTSLLFSQNGAPVQEVLEHLSQFQDLGDWTPRADDKPREGNNPSRDQIWIGLAVRTCSPLY